MSGDGPADLGDTRPGSKSAATRRVSLAELPTQVPAEGESLRTPVETELPPPALEVSEVLGIGGMGVVYKANQTDLARPVAFKRLIDAPTPQLRARFVREARLTAHLDHPNIVPVYLLDPGSPDTPSGYAMKLVEGKTLATIIREAREALDRGEPLDDEHRLETRLEHFLKVCDAIAFAHDRRIIHRDLKPANIMIGAFGAVYVMDWGIARMIGKDEPDTADEPALAPTRPSRDLAADVQLTRDGMFIGSLKYMSPEQAQGQNDKLDGRSDQYALGLVLHELVALAPAFTGPTEQVVLEAVTNGKKHPLDTLDGRPGQAPRELRAIVARATAYAPNARYRSVRELADDVRRYLHGEAVYALPEGPLGKLLRFMSRHRRATAVAFAGVIVAAALAITWTRYRQAQNELAARERGARLTALYGDVARQARRIDADLFRMEEALEGLSRAAEWALVGPDPMPEEAPIFFDTDFANPRTRPDDFGKTAYRWEVSLDHTVVGVAPGVDREAARPRIRRITPLRTHIQRMVIAAAVGDATPVAPDAARALLAQRKSPIDYAYVDLPEGIHVVWPGMAALPPNYDVRTASFYQMSVNKRGKRWGAPYIDSTTDAQGDELVLPVTQGLWSPTGEFLGVAGVETTVTKMVETSMVLPTRKVLRAALVTDKGGVVVDSHQAGQRFQASGKDEAIAFAPYDLPEVVEALRTSSEGLRETTRNGAPIAVAFVRLDALDALGWYYVVEVDAATLGAR